MGLLHLNYNLFIIVYVPRRFIVHINKFSNKIYKKNKLHVVMYIYILLRIRLEYIVRHSLFGVIN